MTRHIPNLLTCGNLFSGCIGIASAWTIGPEAAVMWVWIACVFDFLDGFAARKLGVTSSIGKELDSLADMVSFGVLPGTVMYQWMATSNAGPWFPYAGFLITVFSALRLAKFNVDTRQSDVFIGLPTPANSLLITGLAFLPDYFQNALQNHLILAGITILSSLALVAPVELFALKFKNFSWSDNKVRFTFLLLAVLLIVWIRQAAQPVIILSYVLISLLTGWAKR